MVETRKHVHGMQVYSCPVERLTVDLPLRLNSSVNPLAFMINVRIVSDAHPI